jgi:hypothetical protein
MGPFFLLAGLAIEAKLKGLRVRQMIRAGEPREDKDGKLVKCLRTHGLLRLASDAGINGQLSPAQTSLMRKLTQYVTWAGRYPRPIAQDEEVGWEIVSTDMATIEEILAVIEAADQELRTIRGGELDRWRSRRTDG